MVGGLYAEQNYPQVYRQSLIINKYLTRSCTKLHGKVHNLIRKLKLDYDAVLNNVDIIATPTLPWVAKKMLVREFTFTRCCRILRRSQAC
jgi:amidase